MTFEDGKRLSREYTLKPFISADPRKKLSYCEYKDGNYERLRSGRDQYSW